MTTKYDLEDWMVQCLRTKRWKCHAGGYLLVDLEEPGE